MQAGELLFQKRVVGCACFLTFKPLQVPRNPRVMAFTPRAREDIPPKGPNEVIELSLGALPVHARLPLPVAFSWRCSPLANSLSRWPASVSPTTPSALFNACPARSARDFAWCARTCSTISETLWSRCNVFTFQGSGRRRPHSILFDATHSRSPWCETSENSGLKVRKTYGRAAPRSRPAALVATRYPAAPG